MIASLLLAALPSPPIRLHTRVTMPVRQASSASRSKAEAAVARIDGRSPEATKSAIAMGDAAFEPTLKTFLAVSASYDAKYDFTVERRFNDLVDVLGR